MLAHRKFFTHFFAPFSLSLLLASCSQFHSSPSFSTDLDLSSDYYLRQSQQATDVENQTYFKLLAVRALLAENKIPQAQGLLQNLDQLSPQQAQEKILLQGELALALKQYEVGLQQLQRLHLSQLLPEQNVRFLQLTARIQAHKQDYLSAIRSLTEAETLLNTTRQKQANNDALWAILRDVPAEYLQDTLPYSTFDPNLQGWLTLGLTYHQYRQSPEDLRQAITTWRMQHPEHTANLYFPRALERFFHFQHFQPQHIALLLPLSGNVALIGNTVKQGFEQGLSKSSVKITAFDTRKASLNDLIQEAKAQGADTLVGPLLKQNVEQLLAHPSWWQGLNVLALNADPQSIDSSPLCHYGLSPEDEAYASADKMWQENITRPLVLVPKNAFGQRIAFAFQRRWESLGGGELEMAYYNNMEDLRPILVRTLGIVEVMKDPKTGKAKPMSQSLPANFQPIQGVFALGNNQQLADIKTAIDNTEMPIPLFTTSRIHSPNNQASYRLLMNNVQFTDLPLFQNTQSAHYTHILKQTKGDYSLMRLYAFGEDAGRVVNHLNELKNLPDFQLLGLTGNLSADERCHIQRQMTWFKYENGALRALPSPQNQHDPSRTEEQQNQPQDVNTQD